MAKRTNISLQESIKEYAGYSDEDFQSLTIKELRHVLSTELGVTNIQREDGSIIPTNSGRKGEIIKAIKAVVHPVKVVESIAPSLSQEQINLVLMQLKQDSFVNIEAYGDHIFTQLVDYVRTLWNDKTKSYGDNTQRPHEIAINAVVYLMYWTDGEGKTYADATKLSHASLINKRLQTRFESLRSQSPEFMERLAEAVQMFRSTKAINMQPVQERVDKDRAKRQAQRKEVRVPIDPTNALKWAREVLEFPESFKWWEVSYALTLATGRRQGEIHSTASFKPYKGVKPSIYANVPDSHLIEFHGQLKTKKGAKPYTIPTLLPAELVINGHNALKLEKKVYEPKEGKGGILEPSSSVNQNIAASLARYGWTDEFFEKFFDRVQDFTDDAGNVIKVRHYHRVREIYGQCVLKSFSVNDGTGWDGVELLKQVFGHQLDQTSKSYSVNLQIIPGSETWVKG